VLIYGDVTIKDGVSYANDPSTGVYDEIEIEDMDYDELKKSYFYPCPCGDKFFISLADLKNGEEIAKCPTCSLRIRVIYDPNQFAEDDEEENEEDN